MFLYAAFSPDGEMAVSSSVDGTARIWRIDGNRLKSSQVATLVEVPDASWRRRDRVKWAPDSRHVLAIGDELQLLLWDARSGKAITLGDERHKELVYATFGPNARKVIGVYRDSIAAFSVGGATLWSLDELDSPVTCAREGFAKSEVLVGFESGAVGIWSLRGDNVATFSEHSGAIVDIDVCTAAQTVASAAEDESVWLWGRDGRGLARIPVPRHARRVCLNSRGDRVLVTSAGGKLELWGGDAQLIRRFRRTSDNRLEQDPRKVYPPVFSPDGSRILTEELRLYDENGDQVAQLGGRTGGGPALYSPDGSHIASIGGDAEGGSIQYWRSDGSVSAVIRLGGERAWKWPSRIVFSPNGRLLLATGSWGTAAWDATGSPVITGVGGAYQDLVVSPDGRSVIAVSPEFLYCIPMRDARELAELAGRALPRRLTPAQRRSVYLDTSR